MRRWAETDSDFEIRVFAVSTFIRNSPPAVHPLKMSPVHLLLIRHAEVEPHYQNVFGGRIDMELSPRGHEQARALAQYLRRLRIDAIYTSPMKRVQQTLAPLMANGALPSIVLPGLREADFGDWTGLGWAEVQQRFGVSAFDWLRQLELAAIPNAESAETLRARIEPCLRQIERDHPAQDVAVVCHGGVIRVLLAILLELPLSKMAAFKIEYAGITRVEINRHKAELQLLNFTPWREVAP
jgi:broad specificity phosphatase PhoE